MSDDWALADTYVDERGDPRDRITNQLPLRARSVPVEEVRASPATSLAARDYVPPPGIEPYELPEERDERTRTEERYRIYELRPCPGCTHCRARTTGRDLGHNHQVPVCVAAVATPQGIGPALIVLADDDRNAGVTAIPARGVKDDLERRWISSLWSRRAVRGGARG